MSEDTPNNKPSNINARVKGFWGHNLTKRVLAALALLPPVVLLVVYGGTGFHVALMFVGSIMAYEWFGITRQKHPALYTAAFVLLCAGTLYVAQAISFLPPQTSAAVLVFSLILLSLILALIVFEAPKGPSPVEGSFRWALASLPYVLMFLISLVWIRYRDAHGLWLFWVFLSVWAMDVGGYFAGRAIGGAKLAPAISPSKTWAGLIGGMLLAAITSAVFALIADLMSVLSAIVAGMLMAVVAQAGDLFESFVKRRFACKDSGNIIPGHGGILDRVDGLVFAAPMAAVAMSVAVMLMGDTVNTVEVTPTATTEDQAPSLETLQP